MLGFISYPFNQASWYHFVSPLNSSSVLLIEYLLHIQVALWKFSANGRSEGSVIFTLSTFVLRFLPYVDMLCAWNLVLDCANRSPTLNSRQETWHDGTIEFFLFGKKGRYAQCFAVSLIMKLKSWTLYYTFGNCRYKAFALLQCRYSSYTRTCLGPSWKVGDAWSMTSIHFFDLYKLVALLGSRTNCTHDSSDFCVCAYFLTGSGATEAQSGLQSPANFVKMLSLTFYNKTKATKMMFL